MYDMIMIVEPHNYKRTGVCASVSFEVKRVVKALAT